MHCSYMGKHAHTWLRLCDCYLFKKCYLINKMMVVLPYLKKKRASVKIYKNI